MRKIKLYQVDAFTDTLFSGNPAAVCLLDVWLNEEIMQNIAAENNLAETAFVVIKNEAYEIRWFTPSVEVDLCGHATLAAAHVFFYCLNYKEPQITFNSPKSGELMVTLQNGFLYLNFPTDTLVKVEEQTRIEDCIQIKPNEVYKGKTDYIAVLNSESEIRNLKPDLSIISTLKARGLVVTARGDKADFVSRFFAPQSGINEDPVTGSAHTSLIPIWSDKLGKMELTALQLSARGGELHCTNKNDRCLIGGKTKLYLTGEIMLD